MSSSCSAIAARPRFPPKSIQGNGATTTTSSLPEFVICYELPYIHILAIPSVLLLYNDDTVQEMPPTTLKLSAPPPWYLKQRASVVHRRCLRALAGAAHPSFDCLRALSTTPLVPRHTPRPSSSSPLSQKREATRCRTIFRNFHTKYHTLILTD